VPEAKITEEASSRARGGSTATFLQKLIGDGLISEAQARDVRALRLATGRTAPVCLAELGFVGEDRLVDILSKLTGLPVENPSASRIDPALVARVPLRTVHRRSVLPLRREGDVVVVAVADPRDVVGLDEVRGHLGMPVRAVIAGPSTIAAAAEIAYHPARGAALEAVDRIEPSRPDALELPRADPAPAAAPAAGDAAFDPDIIDAAAEAAVADSPVVRLTFLIFQDAIRRRASDVHIEPGPEGVTVRFRIDGVLRDVQVLPRSVRAFITARLKVVARMNVTVTRQPQDARTTVVYEGRTIDARVSTLPTIHGEKIVVRLLDGGATLRGLEALLPSEDLPAFESLILRPQGLALVTGPTGSGKTTTLYAALRRLSERTRNVVTLEDPVEYRLAGVNQVQMSPEVDFATALRSILRQDPNVVLIGEIRDGETARIAFQAANVGQLVLSTLHTNDAAAAAARLHDLGVEPFAIAEGLNGIVAQRLCRRLCARCRRSEPAGEAEIARWGAALRGAAVARAVGCDACEFVGYHGRVAVHEILRVTPVVKDLLLQRGSEQAIRRAAREAGARSMLDAALARVVSLDTSLDAVEHAIPADPAREDDLCASCSTPILVGQRACTACGAVARPACAKCGADLRPEWRFCGKCAAPTDTKPGKVLVIAGEGELTRRLAAYHRSGGGTVVPAADEAGVLRALAAHRVDAVVLDLGWAGSHELVRKLRQRLDTAAIPILVVARPEELDRDEASPDPQPTRPDDYVEPDVEAETVARRVDLALKRSGQWRAVRPEGA
jgi:type IV pilus assembly protein PilB